MNKDTYKTKEQLLAELAELRKKSKEQEDKLKASNQQLDAQNQQLQAREQTLKKQTHKLGERVKELNCLHSISEAVRTRETMEEILQDVTEFIPPSWQYPQITYSKITLWVKEYKTKNYKDSKWKLSSDIRVNKKNAGKIEVCYLEKIKKEEMKRTGELIVAGNFDFLRMPLRTRTRSGDYRQRALTAMKIEEGYNAH